jgi:hypothetical protein
MRHNHLNLLLTCIIEAMNRLLIASDSSRLQHHIFSCEHGTNIYNKRRLATIGTITPYSPCPAITPNLFPEEESTTLELEVVAIKAVDAVELAVVVLVKMPPKPPAEVLAAAVLAELKNRLTEVESVPPTPKNVFGVLIEVGM